LIVTWRSDDVLGIAVGAGGDPGQTPQFPPERVVHQVHPRHVEAERLARRHDPLVCRWPTSMIRAQSFPAQGQNASTLWYRIVVLSLWYRGAVPERYKEVPVAITATEARKRLFPLIKQVNEDRAPVEIISNHGRAYLVAADDYESMEETDYLLRSPANAARLMNAADEVRRGRTLLTKTMDELQAMADEGEQR
jgi:antitoxin YefM